MLKLISKNLVASLLLLPGPFTLSAQDKEITALAVTLTDSLRSTSKKTIAVVDFTDLQGNVTELGRYLAEEVSVDLAGAGRGIEVVDRAHLRALLQENNLASSGIIDPNTARKLGQIAGVEILITGTIIPFGDSVRFSVKALDTTTARIISASNTEIARTKAIEELLNRGVASPQPGGGGNRANSLPSLPVLTIDAEEFRFTLQSCRLAGSSVACSLTVRNDGNSDRFLDVPRSRLVDGEGQVADLDGASLGGHREKGSLVPGVPMSLQLRFAKISPNISEISLLEIDCVTSDGRRGRRFKAEFRAVPLLGRQDAKN